MRSRNNTTSCTDDGTSLFTLKPKFSYMRFTIKVCKFHCKTQGTIDCPSEQIDVPSLLNEVYLLKRNQNLSIVVKLLNI